MAKGRVGGSMSMEYDPARRERIQRATKRRDEKNAARSGPVASREMTPEERERYGLAPLNQNPNNPGDGTTRSEGTDP